jgi:hypothetical protein
MIENENVVLIGADCWCCVCCDHYSRTKEASSSYLYYQCIFLLQCKIIIISIIISILIHQIYTTNAYAFPVYIIIRSIKILILIHHIYTTNAFFNVYNHHIYDNIDSHTSYLYYHISILPMHLLQVGWIFRYKKP